ncbi:MAG TPA: hypothetical protein PKE69_00375, partial [Pyrinomonadaceae bacterium]|nr:hypothetical protein [Pyrinomonadaceae bacterium]
MANWKGNRWNQAEKGDIEFKTPSFQVKIPTITATPRLINALFQGEKTNAATIFTRGIMQDFVESFDLNPNKKISLNVSVKTDTVYTQNVVGILEGSDAVLKNEYVAVGAHYDHVGMNPFSFNE